MAGQSTNIQKKIDEINKRVFDLKTHSYELDAKYKDLLQNLNELRALQEQTTRRKGSSKPESQQQKQQAIEALFQSFVKWLKSNGCTDFEDSTRIGVSLGVEGNGLIANRDIKEDELILRIPLSITMTVSNALKGNSEIVPLLKSDPLLQAIPSLALAFHLLYEKEQLNSFWSPYIKTLPKQFSIPLYFTVEELEELRGSEIQKDVLKLIVNTIKQYTYLYNIVKKLDSKILSVNHFTYDQFLWAISTVMTRQNQIPLNEKQQQVALIPLWDLINHEGGKITTFYDLDTQITSFHAQRSFQKGEQIKMFYGERPNWQLLMYSGFVFSDNPYDETKIVFHIPSSDVVDQSLQQKKLSLALTNPSAKLISSNSVELSLKKKLGVSSILPFFRALSSDDDELKLLEENQSTTIEKPISEKNEKAAVEMAIACCKKALEAYPTTLEEDKKILPLPDITYHKRACVALRISEKETLLAATTNGNMTAKKKKSKKKKKSTVTENSSASN